MIDLVEKMLYGALFKGLSMRTKIAKNIFTILFLTIPAFTFANNITPISFTYTDQYGVQYFKMIEKFTDILSLNSVERTSAKGLEATPNSNTNLPPESRTFRFIENPAPLAEILTNVVQLSYDLNIKSNPGCSYAFILNFADLTKGREIVLTLLGSCGFYPAVNRTIKIRSVAIGSPHQAVIVEMNDPEKGITTQTYSANKLLYDSVSFFTNNAADIQAYFRSTLPKGN